MELTIDQAGTSVTVSTVQKEETKKPELYNVVLMNDGSTNPEFVCKVLQQVFHCNKEAAWPIMMTAHTSGRAMVGQFSKDIAESKIQQTQTMINQAKAGWDFATSVTPHCELTFIAEPA